MAAGNHKRQPGRSGAGGARHAPIHPLNPSGNAPLLPDLPLSFESVKG